MTETEPLKLKNAIATKKMKNEKLKLKLKQQD